MTVGQQLHRTVSALALLSLLAAPFASAPTPASAAPPAVASTVTLVGSLQSEVGCAGDWDPTCAASYLTYDAADDVWQATFTVPAGAWEYKVALNNDWLENYGANATPSGANIALNLAAETVVKFIYDDKSHWITSNVNHMIAVAPGIAIRRTRPRSWRCISHPAPASRRGARGSRRAETAAACLPPV